MLPVIATERLTLRPWSPADIDALHRLWTHPSVRQYLWDDEIISRQQAAEIVESAIESAGSAGIGFWGITKKGSPDLVGFCGFRFLKDSADIELLYGLQPEFWVSAWQPRPPRPRFGTFGARPVSLTYTRRRTFRIANPLR
jgi:ribosomal-protein-alanine N-acetyltransferase